MKTASSMFSRSPLTRALWVAVLGATSVLAMTEGLAQSSTGAEAGGLEEVIVTAQRRAETLQSVPLAVSVFTGEALREQGLLDLKSLSERTPGLFMGEQKPGQAQWFIRGVGSNDDGATADQSVPLFIDEQYIPRTAGQVVDLFDLERVEVAKDVIDQFGAERIALLGPVEQQGRDAFADADRDRRFAHAPGSIRTSVRPISTASSSFNLVSLAFLPL